MKSEFLQNNRNISVVLWVVIFFFLGLYLGNSNRPEIDQIKTLNNKEAVLETYVDFAPFWKTWNLINEKSAEKNTITDQDRVYGAISGLVGALDDPYSVFFTPEAAKMFEEEISGNFTGVGMEIGMKNKVLTIITPLKNTPAEKAGLRPGDQILKIGEEVTSGMDIDESIKLIRGEKGTTVSLTIFREGYREPKEFKIVRDIINIPTLDLELRPDGIFVIKLYSFSANATNLWNEAMRKFMTSGSKKLLLDLRGNPGGYLEAAVDVASWFLPGGKVIVTENYGENKKSKIFRSRGYNAFGEDLNFAILINGGSASASEIVAGAMQDYGRATLVGETSFGKGSVQEVINVTKDTLLKITVAKWFTPKGNMIDGKGLTPNYEVKLGRDDYDKKKDPQMEKAIELLLK